MKAEYIDQAELAKFLSRLSYVPVDAKSGDGFAKLKKALGNSDVIRVFYLAVAPALFGDISDKLKEHKLVTPNSRIVVEKPIGRDLASAQALNDLIGDDFGEHQIYRIDHYLGKETVQNLMALRFANVLFEPIWNSAHIDHVQITVAETVGLEDRAATTTRPARCATWCRTTCCSCSASSPWSRRPRWTPMRCATKS